MANTRCWIFVGLLAAFAAPAFAQSFRVQCPDDTITHPSRLNDNNAEPTYVGPTQYGTAPVTVNGTGGGYQTPTSNVNGAIKCQQISGGDGYASMGDGTQTYLFSFGPLSGLSDIALGNPGSEFPSVFNKRFPVAVQGGGPGSTLLVNRMPPGYPTNVANASTVPLSSTQLDSLNSPNTFNGAVGLDYNVANTVSIYDITQGPGGTANIAAGTGANVVTVIGNAPLSLNLIPGVSKVVIADQPATRAPGRFTRSTFPMPISRRPSRSSMSREPRASPRLPSRRTPRRPFRSCSTVTSIPARSWTWVS